jgi:DNA repair protein RadC
MVKESTIAIRQTVNSLESAVNVLKPVYSGADREIFTVVTFDSKMNVTGVNICHIGTLNMSVVGGREVFKAAILNGASSIIVAHNHPSGDQTPSPEDWQVTSKLKEIGTLLDIPVMDHIIFGDEFALSMEYGNQVRL